MRGEMNSNGYEISFRLKISLRCSFSSLLVSTWSQAKWNLRSERIKEDENKSWEDCKNKIYDLLENKLEMDIENVVIERSHRTGKKNKNRSRPIVAQFSFYKDKMNISKNCKKLKNKRFSIYEDFSRETAAIHKEKWQEVLANREKGMISYLNYRTVICKQRVR